MILVLVDRKMNHHFVEEGGIGQRHTTSFEIVGEVKHQLIAADCRSPLDWQQRFVDPAFDIRNHTFDKSVALTLQLQKFDLHATCWRAMVSIQNVCAQPALRRFFRGGKVRRYESGKSSSANEEVSPADFIGPDFNFIRAHSDFQRVNDSVKCPLQLPR
jgi:hypothetical protein